MENKREIEYERTFFGIFKQAIKSSFAMIGIFLGKQKDNQMLKDLGIKKGWKNGIIDTIYVLTIVPIKIMIFLLKPNWGWVHFVQRHLVSPVFEVEALTGSESPSRLLGEVYEGYLYHLKGIKTTGIKDAELKPSIKILERLMVFAKIRVITTLFIFIFGASLMYQYFIAYLSGIGFMGLVTTLMTTLAGIGSGYGSSGMAIGGVTIGMILYYGVIIYAVGMTGYLLVFIFRFFIESIRSIMYADKKMMQDFVDDSLHYTISQAINIYGEDIAFDAYQKLLDNVVTSKDRYTKDDPYYKKLELKKNCGIDDFAEDNKNG